MESNRYHESDCICSACEAGRKAAKALEGCERCKFSVVRELSLYCHKSPPVIFPPDYVPCWPPVPSDEWCGEWSAK